VLTQILKSPRAAKFTIQNHHRAKFWELCVTPPFVGAPRGLLESHLAPRFSVEHDHRARWVGGWMCVWVYVRLCVGVSVLTFEIFLRVTLSWKFSKVSSVVIFYSRLSSELTFEKLCPGCHDSSLRPRTNCHQCRRTGRYFKKKSQPYSYVACCTVQCVANWLLRPTSAEYIYLQNVVPFIGFFCKRDLRVQAYRYTCVSVRLHMWLCMGWLWLVGSSKSQVSFAEYSHRALLKKRPIIVRSLLIVATPYLYTALMCVRAKRICTRMNE